jgi:DGQHR domain-containing protein
VETVLTASVEATDQEERHEEEALRVTNATKIEIPVILGQKLRKGRQVILGPITVAQLAERFAVPFRNFSTRTGYQRPPSSTRINQLKGDLSSNRVDLPTAVLLSLRDFKKVKNLIEHDGHTYLVLTDEILYVVDGQHRIAALIKLFEKDPDRWGDYVVAATILLGANEMEEMEQFYVVNSTAKSVRTDLAFDLLKQQAESNPLLREALDERGQGWKVEGQTLVEELAKTPVWKGRIRFPNEAPGDTLVGSAAMVNSLRPLLVTAYFQMISTPNQVTILDAFWQGIRKVLPEAFHDPEHFAVQKTLGVNALHNVMVAVLEYIRSAGQSVTDPEIYADLMREPLTELDGETQVGEVAQGIQFWVSGPDGAAGQFSSNAGQRVLTARIRRSLPRVEVN